MTTLTAPALFKHLRPAYRTRTRPADEPIRDTPRDRHIAAYFNFTPEQWADMPPLARDDYREEYTWGTAA